jgi:hypothetical protein
MTILEALLELVTIWIPELLGERVTSSLLRRTGGRWQRVASGDRRRAEEAVRFLRRQHVNAWVHPTGHAGFEVVVRTADAEVARRLLHAPSSGRE